MQNRLKSSLNFGEELMIQDVVHGSIFLSKLSKAIIDTDEFQRLREVKQLGISNLVFPSACHTRFEHSLGTGYLCGLFLKILRENLVMNNSPLSKYITDVDIIMCEIAGLCHDLGHGPFSHMFENVVSQHKWSHEEMSCQIFSFILQKYSHIRDMFKIYNLEEHIYLIKQIILGGTNLDYNIVTLDSSLKSEQDNLDELIDVNKYFLFQIVCNKFNGIDCDKLDYLLRDSYYTGIRNNFDVLRYFKNCHLTYVKSSNSINICVRDKEVLNLNEMFQIRWKLHRQVYQHKTTKSIEIMLTKALKWAWKSTQFELLNKEVLNNPDLFCKLNDTIFDKIANFESFNSSPYILKAKSVINNIKSRNLLKMVGQAILPIAMSKITLFPKNIKNEILFLDTSRRLDKNMLHVVIINISLGENLNYPLENVIFYTKNFKLAKIRSNCVSHVISGTFNDIYLMLFYGDLIDTNKNNMDDFKLTAQLFNEYCKINNLMPINLTTNDKTGYFTDLKPCKRLDHECELKPRRLFP